jgi:GNAT superfamily N-acetyltransferase
MYYRSDWPQLGLDGPLSDGNSRVYSEAWQGTGNSKWRWISELDDFESQLYEIPIWNLRLEILDSGEGWLAGGLNNNTRLTHSLQDILQQFLERAPWSHAYVAAKVVQDEPLCQVLIDAGFEQVEHRCLYRSNVGKLRISRDSLNNSVRYQSLAAVASNQRDGAREQILEICKEGFKRGYSRHFSDDFLLQRAPGLTYILDVMKRNFERVPLHLFLLALDADSDRLCGFSILGERPGRGEPQYTQLLSAVRKAYRGKGVYAGLTQLLTETLPNEAQLLNFTHAENHAMRRAYQNTGRLHYADTLVLRRIFGSAMQSGSN